MAIPSYVYVVGDQNRTISTAITILQIQAGATSPIELIRASLSQRGSTTSAQERVQIVRKTAGATVTPLVPLPMNAPRDPGSSAISSTTGTGRTGTGEGTDGDVLVDDGFNVLNGWLWLPTPEERISVPASGWIALKFPL